MNDLDDVAGGDRVLAVASARHDRTVDLHRDGTLAEAQMLDEGANAQPFGNVAARSVDGDFHGAKSLAAPPCRALRRGARFRARHVPICPSFFLPS